MTRHLLSASNKRLAIIGLNHQEEQIIRQTLAQVSSSAQRVTSDGVIAKSHLLAPFHACIVDASLMAGVDALDGFALSDIQRRPILAVTDETGLFSDKLSSSHPTWDLLVRPLRSAELLLRLAQLINRCEPDCMTFSTSATPRILVVDDDEVVRALLSTIIETAGFRSASVANATEALTALAGSHFDLVLLDLSMPEVDGFKFLKLLQANSVTRPPVLVVTSSTSEEDVIRSFGFGADDYVSKPIHARELIARVERTIRNHKSSQSRDKASRPLKR